MPSSLLCLPLIAVLVASLAGCAARREARSDAHDLRASMHEHAEVLDETARQANSLSETWAGVAASYAHAEATYRQAAERFAEARERSGEATEAFRRAAELYEQARFRWVVYRYLVQIAARIDAHNMDAAGVHGADIDCTPVSPAAYRRLLRAQGIDLSGKDLDHIVPRSLGGADHPSNYMLLDASTNRSIGNLWTRKCSRLGIAASTCAKAAAVSRACGTFRP
jgi:uncharacterized protein YukE